LYLLMYLYINGNKIAYLREKHTENFIKLLLFWKTTTDILRFSIFSFLRLSHLCRKAIARIYRYIYFLETLLWNLVSFFPPKKKKKNVWIRYETKIFNFLFSILFKEKNIYLTLVLSLASKMYLTPPKK